MAENDSNNKVEDVDMSENDGERIVTMMDVLQEEAQIEEDANAVLGASDEKNCTYSKGYIKRQALYACVTCIPDAVTDSSKHAAFCLACSLHCHENHDVIELYTKRNFRCDCGNAKFNSKCQFITEKSDYNDENKYNQNFSGKYCICNKPYPDPDSNDDDDMIQCIVCEDWFHTDHLEATVPSNDQYSEMICKGCMDNNLFLHDYSKYAIGAYEMGYVDVVTNGDEVSKENSFTTENEHKDETENNDTITSENNINDTISKDNDKESEENSSKEVLSENVNNSEAKTEENLEESEGNNKSDEDANKKTEEITKNESMDIKNIDEHTNGDTSTAGTKRKLSIDENGMENDAKKKNIEEKKCTKPKSGKTIFKGATFWSSDFRQKLCTCNKCIEMYKDLSVLFLIDPEDTVTAYEALGKEKSEGQPTSQYERGLQALSSLDRVQQINALTEYNNMKDKLLDFLKNFKDRKEIVKEADIKEFFAGMKARKEPDGVYFYHKY